MSDESLFIRCVYMTVCVCACMCVCVCWCVCVCVSMDTRAGNGLETSLTSCYGRFMVTTIPFLAHL